MKVRRLLENLRELVEDDFDPDVALRNLSIKLDKALATRLNPADGWRHLRVTEHPGFVSGGKYTPPYFRMTTHRWATIFSIIDVTGSRDGKPHVVLAVLDRDAHSDYAKEALKAVRETFPGSKIETKAFPALAPQDQGVVPPK